MSGTVFDKTIDWKYKSTYKKKYRNEQVEGLTLLWKWAQNEFIIPIYKTDDYFEDRIPIFRELICYIQNILIWLMSIRFFIIYKFRNQWIDIILGNPLISMKGIKVLALCLILLTLLFAFIGLFLLVTMSKRKSHFIVFYHKMQVISTLDLNQKNCIEFQKKAKFMANYIITVVRLVRYIFYFLLTVLYIIILHKYPSIYWVISIIIWSPLTYLVIRCGSGVAIIIYYFIYILSLYLKLRFIQICENLKFFQKTKSDRFLIRLLKEHEQCCRLTMGLNNWARYLAFVYYYLIIPTIDSALVYIFEETDPLYRYFISNFVFLIIIQIFFVNYLLSSISRSAHSSYPFLISVIARYKFNRNIKFKALSLAEKLSGPIIGIYCYNLFPFTNYEFYLFTRNCVSYFILFCNVFVE